MTTASRTLPAVASGSPESRDVQRFESPALTLGGVSSIQVTIDQLKAIRTFVKQELVEHVDFGVIPGTGNKNVLFQPGAQKVAMFYNTYPEFDVQRIELGEGHMEALVTTRLVSRTSRDVVAMGMGSCSTMESKYRWRNGARSCPTCGKADTIIKGKEEYGGGWICFNKKGGCGAKFSEKDPAIIGQVVGRVENPDIYDQRNTVLKMAMKRSMVSAAISLGCMSELFTQDLDDVYDLTQSPASQHEPHADHRGEESHRAASSETWARFAAEAARDFNGELDALYDEVGLAEPLRSQGKVSAGILAMHIAAVAVERGAPAPKKRTQEWASGIAVRLYGKKPHEVEAEVGNYLAAQFDQIRAKYEPPDGPEDEDAMPPDDLERTEAGARG